MVRLEHIIEGKVGHFLLDHDTPLPIAKEMLFQFLKYLGQIEDNVKAQQGTQETPVEQVSQEEISTPQE